MLVTTLKVDPGKKLALGGDRCEAVEPFDVIERRRLFVGQLVRDIGVGQRIGIERRIGGEGQHRAGRRIEDHDRPVLVGMGTVARHACVAAAWRTGLMVSATLSGSDGGLLKNNWLRFWGAWRGSAGTGCTGTQCLRASEVERVVPGDTGIERALGVLPLVVVGARARVDLHRLGQDGAVRGRDRRRGRCRISSPRCAGCSGSWPARWPGGTGC